MHTADPDCPWCLGEGVVDSGGVTPWDAPIDIPCGCTYACGDYAPHSPQNQSTVPSAPFWLESTE